MDELARRFRHQASERRGLRYPEKIRQLALEYLRLAEMRGHSRREIAGGLGLCEATLSRWLQEEVPALHEVVVIRDDAASARPVVVMPSGIRVEGLSERELLSLLAALR